MRKTSPDPRHVQILGLLCVWVLLLWFDGTNLTYLLTASIVCMLLFSLLIRKNAIIPLQPLPCMMVLLCCLLLLSPLWSIAPYRSWLYSWVWLMLPMAFFLFLPLKIHVFKLSVVLALSGAVLSLLAIYQFHILTHEFSYRASGLLLDANSFSGLLNLLLLPSIAWLMAFSASDDKDAPSETVYMWLAVILMVGGVCATGSRAGLLVMVVGIVLLMLLARLRGVSLKPGLMVSGVALIWLAENLLFAGDAMLQRMQPLQTGHDPSLSARFMLWDSAWQLIATQPWWGTGMGTFELLYPQVRSVAELETAGAYVHSDILQVLLEGGWLMLLLVAAIISYAAYYLWQVLHKSFDERSLVLLAMALGILLAAAHAVVNFNFYNACILFAVGVYLACLYNSLTKTESRQGELVGKFYLIRSMAIPMVFAVVAIVLLSDIYAAKLQKPMMEKGLQADYSDQQCRDLDILSVIRPSMPGLKLAQGICELKLQSCEGLKEAIAHANEAISTSPYQAELYAMAAQLNLMAPQCVNDGAIEARRLLVQAVEHNPAYIPARYLLSQLDHQQGRKVALAWLTEGLKIGMNQNQRKQLEAWLIQAKLNK